VDAGFLGVVRPILAITLICLGLAAVAIVDRGRYPTWLNPARRRAIFHGVLLAGWIYAGYYTLTIFADGGPGGDAFYYWSVDVSDPYVGRYGGQWGTFTLFPYSPAAALVASTFALLPWPLFALTWSGLLLLVALWLSGGHFPLWLAFPPLIWLVIVGNIELLMAAAIVLGFRWPQAWSFIVLTKVTPALGLLWFVVRREWVALGKAFTATLVIVVVTAIFLPQQWRAWVGFLTSGSDEVNGWLPLALRLPAAALLVIWGAHTDRRWTVLAAMLLAVPHFSFATAGALVALSRPELARQRSAGPATDPVDAVVTPTASTRGSTSGDPG